jgi:hypothetical protein
MSDAYRNERETLERRLAELREEKRSFRPGARAACAV